MAELDENNIEEYIEKAIKQYQKKNLLADSLFWSTAVSLLKRKYKKEIKIDNCLCDGKMSVGCENLSTSEWHIDKKFNSVRLIVNDEYGIAIKFCPSCGKSVIK